MPLRSSATVGFLLIGGRSVLGAPLTDISEVWDRVLEDTTGLAMADDVWAGVGQQKFQMTQSGFYNNDVGGYNEALEVADPQVLLYAPSSNTVGDELVALSGVRTTFVKLPARGVLHKATATYFAAQGPEDLNLQKILANLVARTTLGPTNLAIVDWGAATTLGGAVYVGLSALTLDGGTSLGVSVHHSTDNFGADDTVLQVFTNITGIGPAAERIAIPSGTTIKRYTRIQYVFNGASGVNRTATFAAGIGRSN